MTPTTPSKRIVGVSLKMYFDPAQTLRYIEDVLQLHYDPSQIDVFLIPDFLTLSPAASLLAQQHNSTALLLGAQDCFWEDHGAYTGEVSPRVLRRLGCSLVELGHAERRRLFGETDEQVQAKAQAVTRNDMTPLVCIGERSHGSVEAAVDECWVQAHGVLDATTREGEGGTGGREIIFAYEPVWAIGQAASASAEYVVAVVRELRRRCGERRVRFLYGGSAGPGTFTPMSEGLDGLFLGRFAHDVRNLQEVIAEIVRV